MRKVLILILLLCAITAYGVDKPIDVSTFWLWSGQSKAATPTDPMVQLMKEDPGIRVSECGKASAATAKAVLGITPTRETVDMPNFSPMQISCLGNFTLKSSQNSVIV